MGLQKTRPSLFCPNRYKTPKIIPAFIPFSPVLLAIVGIFNLNTKLCPMSRLPSLERSLKHNTSTSSLSLNLKDQKNIKYINILFNLETAEPPKITTFSPLLFKILLCYQNISISFRSYICCRCEWIKLSISLPP